MWIIVGAVMSFVSFRILFGRNRMFAVLLLVGMGVAAPRVADAQSGYEAAHARVYLNPPNYYVAGYNGFADQYPNWSYSRTTVSRSNAASQRIVDFGDYVVAGGHYFYHGAYGSSRMVSQISIRVGVSSSTGAFDEFCVVSIDGEPYATLYLDVSASPGYVEKRYQMGASADGQNQTGHPSGMIVSLWNTLTIERGGGGGGATTQPTVNGEAPEHSWFLDFTDRAMGEEELGPLYDVQGTAAGLAETHTGANIFGPAPTFTPVTSIEQCAAGIETFLNSIDSGSMSSVGDSGLDIEDNGELLTRSILAFGWAYEFGAPVFVWTSMIGTAAVCLSTTMWCFRKLAWGLGFLNPEEAAPPIGIPGGI
jgi:hypothetical protein